MVFNFKILRKYCDISLYKVQQYAKLVDDNFDVNDVECELTWQVEMIVNEFGITDFLLSGKAGILSFILIPWEDNSEDEVPVPMSIDVSSFEIKFELEFNSYKQMQPSSVDIDLLEKTITIS